ncbi:sine oculis-binding protein isoform X2 [Arctopsyche grandis]|uniref:sine oculis-binding protein isoform X2 n=1 Tax=Arctopsyche grandis TaxID=121162 RepID=UPI00406D7721
MEFAETAMNELLGWYGYEARGGQGPRGPVVTRTGSPSPGAQPPVSPNDDTDDCSWCKNQIPPETNALSQSVGDRYCSELCFSQSRRATFKRAKTCDWCRHVRHTVSYVDFQDGATQLQFCSDKCLNQYKMHIFCRETQAHLDLNPHLVNVNSSSSASLITPDLWMKNCKSRSVSPTSDRSISPVTESANLPLSPKTATVVSPTVTTSPQIGNKQQLPVISVAPNSKLMKSKCLDERTIVQSTSESRREHRIMKANAKKRRSSRCTSTITSQSLQKHSSNAKPQDLRISSPPLSHEGSPSSSSLLSAPQSQNIIPSPPCVINPRIPNNFPNPLFGMQPPPFFGNHQGPFQDPRLMRPSFFPPPNFMHRPHMFPQEQLRPPMPPPLHQLGIGPPPSVTVLVPYPVVLPIPLPIPIPIPILDFMKALDSKKWPSDQKNHQKPEPDESSSEEPLDFTINSKKPYTDIEVDTNESKNTKEDSPGEADTSPAKSNEFTSQLEEVESPNPEQTLPRFKITRLGSKLSKVIVPKAKDYSESTRPLRKRSRLVDVPVDEDCSPVVSKTRKTVHA